ncbi:PAS/PAC sensor hybrid histidine kinase [Caballeronia calidae]|uniref:histidine kinase n=2 Tax=Caballeronia calidae TaxID=1777139 RepID=A0A158DAM3_9BURK|nr:PAS/PAC sensor hybrid histidine kinase [Caballeronia calidae]
MPKDSPSDDTAMPHDHIASERVTFALLVDAVVDYAIFSLDQNGIVTSWNTGAERLKGYAAEEIIGKHFSVFYPDDKVRKGVPEANLAQARASGHCLEEGWRVRKDGSVFWASVVISVVKDATGKVIGFAKVTRDMTERHRLEELEASRHRMYEFLALLGHELRNPLAPIRNIVNLLERFDLPPKDIFEYAKGVLGPQVSHLTRLVDDLLDVARLTTGKVRVYLQPLDLHEVVKRASENVVSMLDTKSQSLVVELPNTPLLVSGDLVRLTQAVFNLLDNASKFSSVGSRVKLSVALERHSCTLSVADSGRGIAKENLESVFALFFQEQKPGTIQEEDSGLGIGLTIARSIFDLHGGSVIAESDGPGQGTVFRVHLPLLSGPVVQQSCTVSCQPLGRVHPLSILVVDDNTESAQSLAALLEVDGHSVTTAFNAKDGVEVAETQEPDLIFLDLSMPGMSGYEAIALLRAKPRSRKATIVAITGLGLEEDRQRTADAGFDAHVTKPVSVSALNDAIELAVRRKRGDAES